MAAHRSVELCRRAGPRALNAVLLGQSRALSRVPCLSPPQRRCVSSTARNCLRFKLDERTAHSSLDLFKKDTGVIYRILGVDPSLVLDTPERFRDWAVVFGDGRVQGGRHYWEVTVRKSQEFRVGVAEACMSRDECVGTNDCSWVFAYVQRKWFAMTTNEMAPVSLAGKPERVGLLLDYEAGWLGLVDVQRARVIHRIRAPFRGPLCPAFGLWDGELLTHSDAEAPPGLQ